jgi:signal transduction histidine kinase
VVDEKMSVTRDQATTATPASQRIEELGRIIMAYSEITEKLQVSHNQLASRVESLQKELSEKNRLLERRNRLAALGEMAAGMAHEIRNPLGGIQLYASMLAKDVSDRPDSAQLVQKISGGVKRLEALVSQVLQFTREIRISAVEVDVVSVVKQSVELIDGHCVIDAPEILIAVADPLLIGQCVMNLVRNALDAMGGRASAALRIAKPASGEEGRQFRLIVEDTGPGIPAGVMEKIFNPFFTTKDDGTGLGLAIVHRIVEAHDGTISVSNRTEGGAKFEIRI